MSNSAVPAKAIPVRTTGRRSSRWSPPVECWWPEDESEAIGDPMLCLLTGQEDLTRWSADVRRALRAHVAHIKEWSRRCDAVPDAREQLQAGTRVAFSRVARFLQRHPHSTRDELRALADAARETSARAMRLMARQQQRRAAHLTGRTAVPLKSVIDGWRWRDGRPAKCCATGLLLRVEVWRDVRARVRPAEGRVKQTVALAEVIAADLKTDDPRTYTRVEGLRRYYEEEGRSPTAALTRAVRAVMGKHFRTLEALLSQARAGRRM